MKTRVTAQRLREVLDYCADTGVFTWRVTFLNWKRASRHAGHLTKRGRRHISIDGVVFTAHRLAWLYVYGCWPALQLDHINGDKLDDRIANLREANNQQNVANRGALRTNILGIKGVGMSYKPVKAAPRYRARIRVNDKLIHLGYYRNPEDANAAYATAARTHFGEFARSR